MKAGVNGWMVSGFEGEVPLKEAATLAKSLGYDSIEPCFGAGELSPETSQDTLYALRDQVLDTGLEISSLATGFYWGKSLSSPDENERAEAVAFTQAYLRAAQAFGVDAILIVPGAVDVPFDPSRPIVPAQQAYECAQRSLQSLLPLAEETGVVMALENVWNKFLTGPFEFAAFLDTFDSPFVKSYFDAGNVLINGYPDHWIDILGDRIARVHVKNFSRCDGGGALSGFTASLLEGDLNWTALFDALKRIGYDRYLTAEVIVGDAGMPNEAQAKQVCEELQGLIRKHAS